MRILLINTVPTDNNGITNVIFSYLSAIDTTNIQFDYVTINTPDQRYVNEITSKGGKMYLAKRTISKLLSYIRILAHIIKQNKYDAVHIHTNSHTSVVELLAAKFGKCNIRIIQAHSSKCGCVVIHNILSILFNRLYTYGFACSEAAGRFMFGKNSFVIINNGIDIEKYGFDYSVRTSIRDKLNLSSENILIGHVGSFIELKNHRFIVDIFKELYERNSNYRLILIGDGPLQTFVEQKITELNLEDFVYLTGNINNVHQYLNAIDLIVMPSLFEGLPLSLIEQQANGLCCVVANSITREVNITGRVIFQTNLFDAKKWADVIQGILLSKNRQEESIEAVSQLKLSGFSIRDEAKKLEDAYFSIIKNKSNIDMFQQMCSLKVVSGINKFENIKRKFT